MALLPIVLAFVIAGALIGAGMHLLGPVSTRMRTTTTHQQLDDAVRSVIAWSMDRGRLPTAGEFAVAAGTGTDSWNNNLVYVYDGNLAAAATGGLCGRESTSLAVNGAADAAFMILTGGSDFNVDSTPAVSGAFAGSVATSGLDLSRVILLTQLHNRAGCFGRTSGRLTLLNNEMPAGCSGQLYHGDLFAEGGVAPYTWAADHLPSWMILTPVGSAFHASGTPSAGGGDHVDVTLTDAAGSVVQRRFDIVVEACGGSGAVARWEFNEGTGSTTSEGSGVIDATLMGDTRWSTDTPDGSAYSLSFDGRGDYVRVDDHTSLHLTGELTLMAWAKETSVGQYAKVVSRRRGDYFYFLGVDRGRPYGGIGDGASYTVSGKTLLMSLDRWNHLTTVYDDAADRMYLHFDGSERPVAVTQSLPRRVGVNLVLGGDAQGRSGRFNGDLDQVAVYNRALSDDEIRAVRDGGTFPGRVAAYDLDGNVDDAGPGGHDGIRFGGSFVADRQGLPGMALRLDGRDYVRIADHPDFLLSSGLTLTAWFRERVSRPNAKIISRDAGNYFFFLGVDRGRPYGGIGDGRRTTMTRQTIETLPDQWHFVAFVYDDGADSMRIFFDGSFDETTVPQSLPPLPGVDLTIGADFEGTRFFFTGSIDSVALYDQALSVEEIRNAY